jgi:hypothetical protein
VHAAKRELEEITNTFEKKLAATAKKAKEVEEDHAATLKKTVAALEEEKGEGTVAQMKKAVAMMEAEKDEAMAKAIADAVVEGGGSGEGIGGLFQAKKDTKSALIFSASGRDKHSKASEADARARDRRRWLGRRCVADGARTRRAGPARVEHVQYAARRHAQDGSM